MIKNILITITFLLCISKVTAQEQSAEEFSDLKTTIALLEGEYTSNCGAAEITVTLKESKEKGIYLVQTANDEQIIWLRSSNTTFVKQDGEDYTITYSETDNSFKYTNYEGDVCEWIRM